MEMQIYAAGEIQLEDLRERISSAAQPTPHERSEMSGQIEKSREHIEAGKMFRKQWRDKI